MSESTINLLVGFISALFCTWLGHKMSLKSSVSAMKWLEYNKAAASFRAAFFDEIIVCNRNPSDEQTEEIITSIIDKAIDKHEKAMLLFRPFIDKHDLPAFDSACEKYCCMDKRREMHGKWKYSEDQIDNFERSTEEEMRSVVLSRIKRICEFASPR